MKIIQMLFALLILYPGLIAQEGVSYKREYQELYEQRITKTHLNGRYIPKDIDDAMVELDRLIDKPSKDKLKAVSEEVAVRRIHFTFGRWMILHWGFYEGSRLSHELKSIGITYPDDMASALITWYHRRLNDLPMEVEAVATHYAEKRQAEMQNRLLKGEIIDTRIVVKKQ
ncbi:MAG: hypothetical protein OEQ53_22125 [Saprospiraceae bacterium]|nr:hypothetical protein [Saprospiraceae bacterium]